MAAYLTQLKKQPDYLFLQEATAATLQQSLKNLESAFKNFFQKRTKFPKFKSKHKKQSIRYPESCSIKGKGSHNRKKQVKRVAKVHEKIANTRVDFLHKISRELVDENQVIVVENLCIKGLARTKLAKSVLDAGFGMLLNFLGYKLEREGGKLIEVDRFFASTKLCNCCKFKNNSLNLSIREWVCPNCQTHHDRDENAAKNIREEGIRILSTNTVGHTEIEACGDDLRLVAGCCKKHSSVKQESPVTTSV